MQWHVKPYADGIIPSLIPLQLRLCGFLSYRDPVELDFTGFDLACISGPNGAGKSTLLDAITWALFGQARRRDEALINLQSDATEVSFTFRYENADYRVIRGLRRGKTGSLEFQVMPSAGHTSGDGELDRQPWKPLTERTQKETQARIEQVLRLDYETFINASFFLQGKADLFAQQTPAKRKEVLSSILGMEIWDTYKIRAAEMRRNREAELASIVGRIGEIDTELSEEAQRTLRLEELEKDLQQMTVARTAQASALQTARMTKAVLDQQRALLLEKSTSLESLRTELTGLVGRLADRQAARSQNADLALHSVEIESAYKSWRTMSTDLERWAGIAKAFGDQERQRAPLLQEIAAEEALISQEKSQLLSWQEQVRKKSALVTGLESELKQAAALLAEAEAVVKERNGLQGQLTVTRETTAEKTAKNKSLREKMDEIKHRVDTLAASASADCPLCGQPLSPAHRESTLKKLRLEGKQLGDQYRSNVLVIQDLRSSAGDVETRLSSLADLDERRISHSRSVAQFAERLDNLRGELREWEESGLSRLAEVSHMLERGEFALSAKAKLDALDIDLASLGYDAAAHDSMRRRENELRPAEEAFAKLQSARAALNPLENEIRNLQSQIAIREESIARQETELRDAQVAINSAMAELPDVAAAERAFLDLQEQENKLHQEIGAAKQKVAVLGDLRARRMELAPSQQSLALSIGRHKVLESAFGNDGVPALLIEQALPEIELRANEILDRLSNGRMSVHFETQVAFRDRKREDLRETLDIKISDGAGQRDYEMYSGGEAFRVNFAIRLALSQVLAGRKGARLQTLVVDEGFGSQDSQGIQRLIETINLVRHDFAKVLLISHLDELKDAFPTRIEVEKTERGSVLRVD